MEWSGVEWNSVEWNGVVWSRVWSGVGVVWNGVEGRKVTEKQEQRIGVG